MTKQRIAKTLAEAVVGDLVWVCPNDFRPGFQPGTLTPVRKVGRDHVYVGQQDDRGTWTAFVKKTRGELAPADTVPNSYAYGSKDRELAHWRRLAPDLANDLRECTDLETLRKIAFALRWPMPQDFSKVPRGIA